MADEPVKPSVVFGGRELWPFVTGGGIARTLHATLRMLAPTMEVTMITRATFREEYEQLVAAVGPDTRAAYCALVARR